MHKPFFEFDTYKYFFTVCTGYLLWFYHIVLAHLSVTTVAQQKSVGCRCLKERTTHGKCPNISGSTYCRFVICLEIFLAHSLSDSHKRITALNTKVLGQIILNYFLQLFTAQGASWWPPGSQMFLIFNIQIEIIIFYSEIFTSRVTSLSMDF